MQCPAVGRMSKYCVESLELLRAGLTPSLSAASLPIRANSIPRQTRDFYFHFPRNQAGNAPRHAGLTLLSRSFP